MVLFSKAAKKGHAESMIRLGHCYQTGTGGSPSENQALVWYKKSVEAGNPAAEVQIGFIYETGGRALPPDFKLAIEWYEKAAEHHSLKACAGLARIYASASNPSFHDGPKAIKYAAVLTDKNSRNAESFDLLAAACARNLQFDQALKAASEAVALSPLEEAEMRRKQREAYKSGQPFPPVATDDWMQQAAQQGSMWAILSLAERYSDLLDESYDPEQARTWYSKAVEDGSKEAMVPLGKLCRQGAGGPVNNPKAFWCFSEAAEAGVTTAYAPLARMYVGGGGVRCSAELARKWYAAALESGNKKVAQESSAVRQLGVLLEEQTGPELYERGERFAESGLRPEGKVTPLPARTSRVFALYWIAAEKGDTDAMQAVAEMYFYGPAYFVRDTEPGQKNGGIAISYAHALDWYEQLHRKEITLPEYAQSQKRYLEELKKKQAREKGR